MAVEELAITFRADIIDAHVERVSSLTGRLATLLQAASPYQLAALRRTAADLAAPYVTDSGLAIPGQALVVSPDAEPIAGQPPAMYPPA